MSGFKLLPYFFLLLFCSCDQILNSIAEDSAHSQILKDSLEFSYNEKPIALDTFKVINRKKIGLDSFFLVRSFYLNGKPYYDGWIRNNVNEGLTTFYFPSGKIQYTIDYKNGNAFSILNCYNNNGENINGGNLKNGTGTLLVYHPITNSLIYNSSYKNGLKNGKFLSFYSDGNKNQIMVFKNDTAVGDYFIYYHSGKLEEKGNFDMRARSGSIESFYPSGKQKIKDIWKDGIQISFKKYDENNLLIDEKTFIGGKLIETVFYYGSEGNLLSKGQMLNGKKHGPYEYFHMNGNKKTLETYRNDTLLANVDWYENGKIKSKSIFKNGAMSGLYLEYYSTGNIKLEQIYVNGLKEGKYKSYFNNGNVYNEGKFKNDSLSGDLKFFSENGKLKGVRKYD